MECPPKKKRATIVAIADRPQRIAASADRKEAAEEEPTAARARRSQGIGPARDVLGAPSSGLLSGNRFCRVGRSDRVGLILRDLLTGWFARRGRGRRRGC